MALEHPRRDTEGAVRPESFPSVWHWPEMQALGLYLAEVDHGCWGSATVRPAVIGTSSFELYEKIHASVVPLQCRWVGDEPTKGSRAWCQPWGPQLMEVLHRVWRGWCKGLESSPDAALNRLRVLAELLKERGGDVCVLEELCHKAQDRLARHSCVAKLSPSELDFKKHVERGHIPWRNDCRACVYGVSHSRPCRKRKYPHMYTLSLDVTGPFKPGVDVTGAAKYALVGVYTFPRFWRHGVPASDPPPGECSDAHVSDPPPGECSDAHVSDPPPGGVLRCSCVRPTTGGVSRRYAGFVTGKVFLATGVRGGGRP